MSQHHHRGDHAHDDAPVRPRRAAAAVDGSLLRASALMRLAGAAAAIVAIWVGVLWAVA